jgi:thiol-disulfide isomerase/thioredoxin
VLDQEGLTGRLGGRSNGAAARRGLRLLAGAVLLASLGAASPGSRLAGDLDAAGLRERVAKEKGRVVLVNFWATWCAPCREEMPALETLGKDLAPHGLSVVAVNHKEAKSVIETFLREGKLTIPVVMDKDGRVAERYHVYALPATFIVNRQGKVVATVLGSRDWLGPDARDYLGRLLNEPEA